MIELIEKRKSLNLRRKFLLKIMPAESRGMKESPIFTNTFNERIGAIDMARGIAIILMVIGHMGLKCTPYLYAFHMPLFFIISGMTISVDISKCKVQNFVYKKIRTLFIPYILWVLIYCPFNMFSLFLAIYGSRNAIESLQSFGPLWFLPCLMVSEILFFIILKICNCIRCGGVLQQVILILMIVLAIGFGCCIGKVVTLKYKIPWNADVSMISMAFIYVGWFIRQFLLKQLTGLTGWKALLIVGFLLLVLSITYCLNLPISEYGTAYVAMAFSTYGNIIWFYINALIGSLAVIIFSFSFSIPILQSIGRRTLTILVIHSRVRSLLNFMIEKIGLSELYFKFEWLIVVFVVILISIPIDFLLRRYAPNLVGR